MDEIKLFLTFEEYIKSKSKFGQQITFDRFAFT